MVRPTWTRAGGVVKIGKEEASRHFVEAAEHENVKSPTMVSNCPLTPQESGSSDINLICEKLAFEGVTRFEDRQRLPMGICVNLTAYAAKLCFQVAYNPMIIGPYASFGAATELMVQDASAFAGEGEEVSFWQMQASPFQSAIPLIKVRSPIRGVHSLIHSLFVILKGGMACDDLVCPEQATRHVRHR